MTRCEKPDPEDRKNWYRNCCSDLAVLLSDWNNTDSFSLLASLFGMEFMDRRVILFDHSRNVWKMVNQLDQEQSEMITTIASLDLVTMRASYENLTRIPWSVLHIPYHVSFYPITKYQLEKIQELFQSEDYIIINDIELTDQLPSERVRRCFLLENDENSINALKILDGLLQTNIPLEIFLLENKADKKIGEIKLHEIKNILFDPMAMRYDFRRSYGCFINTKYIPMYNIFPPGVSDKYGEYLHMIEENMGMNSYSDYQDVMKRRNLFRTVIVRRKEETYEYDEWSENYPSVLSNNDIINILTDGNYKESILRPYMQIVQELITNLQERTDLFLKLSM